MQTERIISRKEFRELTGISRSSQWKMTREGKLPPEVKLNDNWILGYRYSDYLQWLQNNIQEVN